MNRPTGAESSSRTSFCRALLALNVRANGEAMAMATVSRVFVEAAGFIGEPNASSGARLASAGTARGSVELF